MTFLYKLVCYYSNKVTHRHETILEGTVMGYINSILAHIWVLSFNRSNQSEHEDMGKRKIFFGESYAKLSSLAGYQFIV